MSDKKVKLSVTATGELKQQALFEPKNLDKLPVVKFKPNPNTYMIYPYKTDAEKRESGIFVDSQQVEAKAVIIARGENCRNYEPGDIVLIDASQPIYGFWITGDQYSFIFESTIVGSYTDIKLTPDGLITK